MIQLNIEYLIQQINQESKFKANNVLTNCYRLIADQTNPPPGFKKKETWPKPSIPITLNDDISKPTEKKSYFLGQNVRLTRPLGGITGFPKVS